MKIYGEAEKYINENFYKDSYDAHSKLDVISIMNNKLIADNKAKDPEYFSHRLGVVHASSIYGCLRGTIHSILGTKLSQEPDSRKLGVFQAGNLFEKYVASALGDKIIEQQREYTYPYKSITLVGRSDFLMNDNGVIRIGECKSVHSNSFWYRQREGTLIAWHNQIQLQIYMWLERELFGNHYEAELIYISKDDCSVNHCALKYNPNIIEEIVKPSLDIINEGFEKKDPNIAPVPALAVFNNSRQQWQINWLAKYCDYHSLCCGAGWILEAQDDVYRKNREYKNTISPVLKRSEKPKIKPVE